MSRWPGPQGVVGAVQRILSNGVSKVTTDEVDVDSDASEDAGIRFGSGNDGVDGQIRVGGDQDILFNKEGVTVFRLTKFRDLEYNRPALKMGDNAIQSISQLDFGTQRAADPGTSDLDDGESMLYISDGSADATGSEGDLVWATNDGGTIKTLIVAQVSNATA